MRTKNITYQIEFKDPVSDFGFDMLDLDGGESWVLKAYDGATPPNLLVTQAISSSSYGDGSGNNAVTPFSFPRRPTRDIKRVVLAGRKSIKKFGTGVDNIRTGMAVCP